MTTALITHKDCLDHVTPTGHPERVARLEHILKALEGKTLDQQLAPMAAEEDLLRVHPKDYVAMIKDSCPTEGLKQIDGNTYMSPGSVQAAYRAAGGGIKAVDLVLSGAVSNAFVACRPPGHHAETSTPMGFCLFGNVAIAAKYALDHHNLSRVAVVDFDVHHGNGTQDLLWAERRSLFITSQQMPLWPGSGAQDETGAYDNVINVPLAPHTGRKGFQQAYEGVVFPAIAEFDPDLIIISAGFDAHMDDPLASLDLRDEDFTWVTQKLCELADTHCQGRVVSMLEGGYDLDALSRSVACHVDVLINANRITA